MKIAFLGWGQLNTGGNRVVFEHVNHLIELGHQVDVFFHFGGQPDWFPLKTQIQFTEPFVNKPLLEKTYDFIVATAWICNYELKELSVSRTVNLIQSWDPYVYRNDDTKAQLALNTYRFDDKKMTVSHWLRQQILDDFGQHSHRVPNGIPFNEIRSLMVSTQSRHRIKRVGVVSSTYSHVKGLDLAVETVALVKQKRPDCECVLVSRKQQPYAEGFDTFVSQPTMNELVAQIQSFDVLLHTSVLEGMGLVPLEAMACETPVVLTNSLGVLEYIDKDNAILVNTRKATMLANAIFKVLDSSALSASLIQAGLKTARSKDWSLLLPEIGSVYDQLYSAFRAV